MKDRTGLERAGLALAVDLVTLEAVKALEAAGVRVLLIKGPTVTKWLFENRAERPYGDTDLLVGPDDMPTTRDELRRMGFVEAPRSELHDRLVPGVEWVRERDGAVIDLHGSLHGIGVSSRMAWDVLTEQTDSIWIRGTRIGTLSEPGRALLIALHAFHHGPQEHVLRDVERASEVLPFQVWERAAELASRLDAMDAFAEGLRTSSAGAAVSDRLSLTEETPRLALLSQRASSPVIGYALYLDGMGSMSLRARTRFLLNRLVPSSRDLRWWRDAERFKGPLVAAYFVRLWRMGRRTAGGFKILVRARRQSSGDRRREAA